MATKVGDAEWYHALQDAFPQDLFIRIYNETVNEPRLQGLFLDVSKYVSSLGSQSQSQQVPGNAKKRKLEDGSSASGTLQNGTRLVSSKSVETTFECSDVSVQIPARKKLKLAIGSDGQDARRTVVRLLNPTTNDLEFEIPTDQIEDVFSTPVPDKQARQTFFAILPTPNALNTSGTPAEQVLFTLNETAPPTAASSTAMTMTEDETHVSVTKRAFERILAPYRKTIIAPDANEFASARPQPNRKGEKAYHVNCYRGSKEGYLYFLPTGILFGFKKPLAFFPFSSIDSISYTSVLQRTFNLVIASSDSNSPQAEVKEVEFSMLDQEDFAGIDGYIKKHGLNDASMAAARKAKIHNVNKEAKPEQAGNGMATADEDGRTELEKAEQELQDAEDEEEEDYEASGGESDGEGEESEEDGDGEEYEEVEGEEEEDREEDEDEDEEAEVAEDLAI